MVGRIAKWVGITAIIACLLLALGPWRVVVRDFATAGTYQDYLEQHVQRLDLAVLRQRGLMTKFFPFEVSIEDGRPAEYVILVNGSQALTAFEG